MMECKTCNLSFKHKNNYTKHLKTQRHEKRLLNESTVYSCTCGKGYSYPQSLCVHRKTCEHHKNAKNNPFLKETQQDMKTNIDSLQEVKNMFKQELEEIKAKLRDNNQNVSQIQRLPIVKKRRHNINANIRSNIVKSQMNKCNCCSKELSEYFDIDHIIGLQFGGTDEEDNLQALCCECHSKKSIAENKNRTKIKNAIQLILNGELSCSVWSDCMGLSQDD